MSESSHFKKVFPNVSTNYRFQFSASGDLGWRIWGQKRDCWESFDSSKKVENTSFYDFWYTKKYKTADSLRGSGLSTLQNMSCGENCT